MRFHPIAVCAVASRQPQLVTLVVLAMVWIATPPLLTFSQSLGPFDPSNARVWDADVDHQFVWRNQCGNNSADHQLGRGFEWSRDSRGFVAIGKGWVGGGYRPGLMMLAFPDGNVMNAEWKVTIPAEKWFRIRYALTNQAAASSTNGLKFTVSATDSQGDRHAILERVLSPGDNRLYSLDYHPTFSIEKITFTHDNLGQEFTRIPDAEGFLANSTSGK
jgi:hypothetical protein